MEGNVREINRKRVTKYYDWEDIMEEGDRTDKEKEKDNKDEGNRTDTEK